MTVDSCLCICEELAQEKTISKRKQLTIVIDGTGKW